MKIIRYDKFNEDGVAAATAGNTAGIGNVIAPIVSAIPGDVAGSTAGSGDIPAYDMAKYFGTKRKRKKKKKSAKESIENFSDWSENSINENNKSTYTKEEVKSLFDYFLDDISMIYNGQSIDTKRYNEWISDNIG